jgi:hypothetical protein
VGLPLCVLLSFVGLPPEADASCPNPYVHRNFRWSDSPLAPEPLPLPEPAGARRWFVVEDSGEMMGLPVSPAAILSLQVDFTGPGELPHKTTRVTVDPNDPKFLLTTAGLTVRF